MVASTRDQGLRGTGKTEVPQGCQLLFVDARRGSIEMSPRRLHPRVATADRPDRAELPSFEIRAASEGSAASRQ